MTNTTNDYDLREKAIEDLTEQQLKSRLHLLGDTVRELRAELAETQAMRYALQLEIERRKQPPVKQSPFWPVS